MEATTHALFLSSETGEQIWVLRSAYRTPADALRAYNAEYGATWPLDTRADEVHMQLAPERAPWGDDPDWHQQVAKAGDDTDVYWKFDA